MATSARIDELRKKFEENPRRYFAPLANEYRKAGDPEHAVAICEEYLPQQPGHMSGHIVYGQALFELGRNDEARQVFETALSLDPENLIALRHLGDIARMAGDAHAARVWYQRVLEADPRNEEIAQLMMSLLSTPVGSNAVDPAAPTPLSTPMVPGRASIPTSAAAIEPAPADPHPATTEEGELPAPVSASPTPFPPPPVTPQSFVSRHAPKEDELLDLDSFDLGGVPLSSLRNAKSAEADAMVDAAPSEHEPEDSGLVAFDEQTFAEQDEPFIEQSFASTSPAHGSEPHPLIDAARETDDAGIEKSEDFTDAFEADAFAIAAKPLQESDAGEFEEGPPGTIELAADIDLGLPDDGGSSSTFADADSPVAGLESFEPGILTGSSSIGATTNALETESFFDTSSDLGAPTADSLVDGFVDDPGAFAGGSAFAQVRDETTEPPASESVDAIEAAGGETVSESLIETPIEEPMFEEASFEESAIEAEMHEQASVEETVSEPFFVESAVQDEPDALPPIRTPHFASDAAPDVPTPFPVSPPPPLVTPQFHEAQPAHLQGDPLMTPAFGHPAPSLASEPEPEPEPIESVVGGIDDLDDLDDLDALATPDSAEAEAHVPTESAPTEEPGAFVTETMATLYLEQGHFDRAIDIYRQLVQQRPDDIALRDRLHAAEERAWGHQRDVGASIFEDDEAAPSFGEAETEFAAPPRTYGGPTIREFLTGILFKQSNETVLDAAELSAEEDASHPESAEPVEDVVATTVIEPAPSTRGTPSSSAGDSISTSLGALFSGADAASTPEPDDRGSLGGHVATPIGGTPAHRAPRELSLDHVFKANPARAQNDPAFSFDQFFSEDAAEESTPSAEPASESRADTNDDIAQFNAWLNGLKKS